MKSGSNRLASGAGTPSSGFTRTSRGLILSEDFASLALWGNEGTWAANAGYPLYLAYPIPRYLLEPTPASSDANGIREGHVMVIGSTWYLYYDAGANGSDPWKIQLARSTDRGKTWSKFGVQIGIGAWAARGGNFIHKVGSTYYAWAVDAYSNAGNIPSPPYDGSIYTSSSPEGTWTLDSQGLVHNSVPGLNNNVACAPCIVVNGGTYHCFYGAQDGSWVQRIVRQTAASPTGPWTNQGEVLPAGTRGHPENPMAWWSAALNRWCMLVNQINDAGTLTDLSSLFISTSLTDWSSAVRYDVQRAVLYGAQANNIDTTQGNVVGVASPFYETDATPVLDGGYIPFVFDGYPTDGNHNGRRILGGVLEPMADCARGAFGDTAKCLVRTVANSDFVAEFSFYVESTTGEGGQLAFQYRRDSATADATSGYQVSFAVDSSVPGSQVVELYKFSGGTPTSIMTQSTLKPVTGRAYRIRIEVSGTSHKIYLDGVLMIDATDATHASGAAIAFKGYRATVRVYFVHLRTSNTVTITGAGSAVSLHSPGGIYVDEDVASITHTHYPMRALGNGATYAEFADGIYGGDEYSFV